ncbi:hypothetical protein X943_002621 [Babesia divergens]|uniref:Uncharacterized protein n=1 Tax=Babesia divergens TaxID=32595 RepID=A0AAD9GD55_BABDI|nr:hypothetical protein X943_002621 [Babesia divergens]
MVVPLCNQSSLFERLLRQFHGAYILARTTEAAHKKITTSGFRSCTELIEKILVRYSNDQTAAKVEFEAESDLLRLAEGDFESQLLDAVTRNVPEFGSQELDFVGYPPWFTEWAVTLAKLLRTQRYKTLDIPPDSRGVILFCSSDDDKETIRKMLGDPESSIFRAVVVFGENQARTFLNDLKGTYKETANHVIVNSDSKPLEECLMDDTLPMFIAKVGETCIAHNQLALASRERRNSVPHISSKVAKSKPTSADIAAMKSIIMAMNDDLYGDSPSGYIDDVCSATDYEIQGLAYIYSALSHVNTMKRHIGLPQNEGDYKTAHKRTLDKAISELDKAINILLKYDCKWDALLAAIFMATIGGDVEARRLGTISATMEIKSKSDFARAALSLELCTFFTAKQRRKMFHLVMAGQLFLQAGLMNLTKRCYMVSLPLYKEKGWNLASDFLHGTLSRCEPLFCIDALNGMADNCEFLNCHTNMKSYEESIGKSSWYNSDREMTHLRRLMKLSVTNYAPDDILEKNAASVVCCAYSSYPALLYGKKDIPPLDGNIPYLVRVPLVILRNNEGVPGKNCELLLSESICDVGGVSSDPPYNTADDFDMQEATITKKIKAKAEVDPAWKMCYEFINNYGNISYRLDSNSLGYNLPKEGVRSASNYPLGADSVIKVEVVNPLHINIHCDDFHLLIKNDQEIWWENATVINMKADDDSGQVHQNPKDNFVYLVEGERRVIYLKFKVTKPKTFSVVGLAWKLFGCVSCWVPLYLSGQRRTKGAPVHHKGIDHLDNYMGDRLANPGLSLSIHETSPHVAIALSKVTRFPENMRPLNEVDAHYCTLKRYFQGVDDDLQDDFNNQGYLSMGETIAGEFVITKLSIKNTGTSPIDSVTLNIKTSGKCDVTNYPLGYRSQASNVMVTWEDMAKCNLGCISGNKTYQVTLQDESTSLVLPGGVLSIFTLMVPGSEDAPNMLCIQGRLTVSSKIHAVNTHMAFWRFYSTSNGLSVSYKYDHSLTDMLQCTVVNKSKKNVESISFYDPDGSQIIPIVRSPSLEKQRAAIGVRRNSELLSALPFQLNWSHVNMSWECGDAFGLVKSEVAIDTRARLLVKIRSTTSSIKYTGKPSIVRIEFVFENPTCRRIPSMQVEARRKQGLRDEHNWFYVGLLTGAIPDISPNQSEHVGFDVVLPLPGMYVFTHENLVIRNTQGISITPCNELMIAVEV